MFTGIIQDIGEIVSIDKQGDWTLTIAANKLPLDKTPVGASISCNGICLTVTDVKPRHPKNRAEFKVQASAETVERTTVAKWAPRTPINLELALKMGDELGGHLVSGHVDGTAKIIDKKNENNSLRYLFEVRNEFAKFLAMKGSIALDGVSLTINEVENAKFGVNIIPHTQSETTLGGLNPGDEVNFEVDLIARYAERIMSCGAVQ